MLALIAADKEYIAYLRGTLDEKGRSTTMEIGRYQLKRKRVKEEEEGEEREEGCVIVERTGHVCSKETVGIRIYIMERHINNHGENEITPTWNHR
jgi:hypothetical protein